MAENIAHACRQEVVPTLLIKPTRGLRFLDLRELIYYRELIYLFTWRNIKIRYKQTATGILWAITRTGTPRVCPLRSLRPGPVRPLPG